MLDHLYDVSEQTQVHYIGCVSEKARYDFSIVYTNQFFGKTLVICMQTGKSILMSADDLGHSDFLLKAFNLGNNACLEELSDLFHNRLPFLEVRQQY